MIIGIDASNIKSGGGLNHLIQTIKYLKLTDFEIKKIFIWAPSLTLNKISNKKHIYKITNFWINKSLFHRVFWNFFILPKNLKRKKCDILFSPGATIVNTNIPIVSMAQNELPFSWDNIKRFGFSLFFFKMILLRLSQIYCFKKSRGIIFLSESSQKLINKHVDLSQKKTIIIGHGLDKKFYKKPKVQKSIKYFSNDNPFRLLYVSDIWPYKNQINVIRAVSALRCEGFPLTIDLVGHYYKPYFKSLKNEILRLDPMHNYIFYRGKSDEVINYYHSADGFVFASSCETYGQILTEAMMSGLPIICSNKSVMPEIIKNSTLYFNPEDEHDLIMKLRKFIMTKELRSKISLQSNRSVSHLTWDENSRKTFSFLSENCKN